MELIPTALLGTIIILLLILVIRSFTNQKDYELRDHLNTNFNQFTDRMDSRLTEQNERNTNFEKETNHNLINFQEKLVRFQQEQFKELRDTLENRLNRMDEKVNISLEQGFEKTNKTFTNIAERLSKIDEAQKKIDSLSIEIVSLQDVLTDKKTRGTFGEVQLNQILYSIFGEKNDSIYQTQYNFGNSRADAVLFAPEPLGTIAIDSKFPLENYRKMIDQSSTELERSIASKQFVQDCKIHIDDIARKYIIPTITSDQALMFVPAEAVFATINAYHQEIIDYAQRKRVWLVSPTTLMSTLTTIQTILINLEREKYAAVIHEQLRSLGTEFQRYSERWDKLSNRLEGVNKDIKDLHITTSKITKRFDSIASTEASTLENSEQ